MEIKVLAGNIAEIKVDAVLVSVFEGVARLEGAAAGIDRALDGAVAQLISQGEIKGKPGEVTIIHSLGKLPSARVPPLGQMAICPSTATRANCHLPEWRCSGWVNRRS